MASPHGPVFIVSFFSACGLPGCVFTIASLSGLCRLRLTRLRARSRRGPKKFLEAATLLGATSLPTPAVSVETTCGEASATEAESATCAATPEPVVEMLPKTPLPALLQARAMAVFDSETGTSGLPLAPVLLRRPPQSRRSLSVRALSCPSHTVMSPSAASTHIPLSRSSDVGLERSNVSNTATASSGDSAS